MRRLRAFTVWQPWASLILIGAKPYEFRPKSYLRYSNAPAIGEEIVVHAGRRPVKPAEIEDLIKRLRYGENYTGLIPEIALPLLERIFAAHKCRGVVPLGAALCTAKIGKPRNAGTIFTGIKVEDSDRGDFNWAWPMTDIRPFNPPIEMRGFQGFWNASLPEGLAA